MRILRAAYAIWTESRLPVQAAALAFFTTFAIAPLLVLLIELAGFVPGYQHHAILRNSIFGAVATHAGAPVATILRALVDAAFAKSRQPDAAAAVASWIAIVLAATGLVGTVRGALETIWHSKPAGGLAETIRDRALGVALVAFLAGVTIVWIAATAALTAVLGSLPGGGAGGRAASSLVEWVVLSFALAVAFKVLPQAPLRWLRAFEGAAIAGALIVAGQFAIGWYLDRSTSANAYGVAGAFVALVLWIYYSSLLFLAGAALTRALSLEYDGTSPERPPSGAARAATAR